jgi:ubiquinone/menaquinone biosynthesis C-methylase UbiE
MYLFMKVGFGKQAKAAMEFKNKYPFMNEEEISGYYQIPSLIAKARLTDLNKACIQYILENAIDEKTQNVLDAACGRGYLLDRILEKYPGMDCTGIDIKVSQQKYKMLEADITNLPFEDKSFDTVLCTHALEHIKEPQKALDEIKRVCKKRLIVVVPRQREYKYTVDLHVNFFPYMFDFKRFIGEENAQYYKLDGDFLCQIDMT